MGSWHCGSGSIGNRRYNAGCGCRCRRTGCLFHSLIGEETPENPEKLAALVATPDASFDSTNQDVQFTLLGMYGDDSQAMLSFQVTAKDGTALQDGFKLPYQLTLQGADGSSEALDCYGKTADIRGKRRGILHQSPYQPHRLAGQNTGCDLPELLHGGADLSDLVAADSL